MSAGGISGREVRALIAIAAAALGLYLSYLLALPFLPSLTWALVLGILLAPLHRRVTARIRRPDLAASLSVAAAVVVVIVPTVLVAQQLAREAAGGALYLADLLRGTGWREAIAVSPRLAQVVARIEGNLDLTGIVGNVATWLSTLSTSLLRGSVGQLVNLVLTFYLLFYFLRDREPALDAMKRLSPLSEAETEELAQRFADTVRATIFGTVAVAAVQGTLGGLIFWWIGLPKPVFWGLVMGLLAILPVLGASIVWIPASVLLALEGEWIKALALAGWGLFVVATIDNLLYPMLVGNRLKLHTVVAFVGAVGGLIVYGAPGLVLGPATIALTLSLIAILKRRLGAAGEER